MDRDAVRTAVHAYYARGEEPDRLDKPRGRVEFDRTCEIIARTLPTAPARIADIGGGSGPYTRWLADRGHRVQHRDLVPAHVDAVRALDLPGVEAAVGDALDLDLADASVDAVLLLGPIYHLHERVDRLHALREALRVVKPGGPVYVAAISRWSVRLDGFLTQHLYRLFPDPRESVALLAEVEASGILPPLFDGSFVAAVHRPDELRREVTEAGLVVDDLVGVEGIAGALHDLEERLDDDEERAILYDLLRGAEQVPELLGASPHLLVTARRPIATAADI